MRQLRVARELHGRYVRLPTNDVPSSGGRLRSPEGWVQRRARLRHVREQERRVRGRPVCMPAHDVRRARSAVRNGPRRMRRYLRVWTVHGSWKAELWWRRAQRLRREPLRSEDVRGHVRAARRRLRRDAHVRSVHRSPIVRRRGDPQRLRMRVHHHVRATRGRLRVHSRRLRGLHRLWQLHCARHVQRRRHCEPMRVHADDLRAAGKELRRGEQCLWGHSELRNVHSTRHLRNEGRQRVRLPSRLRRESASSRALFDGTSTFLHPASGARSAEKQHFERREQPSVSPSFVRARRSGTRRRLCEIRCSNGLQRRSRRPWQFE
jgi:hypothetical protein